ncbi:MAG: deoxyribonuclease V [Chloroflexota bacterium]|nr:deoxyribonuclease V [Chloroflexota bacterium]
MDIRQLHPWNVDPREAMAIQKRLASQVVLEGSPQDVRTVAGADISISGGRGRGAVVLLSYPELRVLESQVVESELTFPYVPGLLAFREVPVLAEAFQRLEHTPDLLLVDGQGLAHPRRFGIACHLGFLLELPTIGCAKSRLVGEHGPLGEEVGSRVELRDGPEVIGLVLRTRPGVTPVYVSAGHRISLAEAAEWVLRLCGGYRLPEPARLAHQAAGGQAIAAAREPAAEQMTLF